MSKLSKISLILIDNLIWVILILYFIINIFTTPSFASYGNIINIFYQSSVLSMLVLAQGLILLLGYMDLSIESTLAFAPVIAVLVLTRYFPAITPGGAIILTLLVGSLIGLFNGIMVTRLHINPFLQTLSMLIILRGLVRFFVPVPIYNISKIYTFVGGGRIFFNIPIAILIMFIIFIVVNFILNNTIYGRQVIAIGGNSMASFISGVNVKNVILTTFIISGLLASIAGLITTGWQVSVSTAMGEGLVFKSFAGAIIGGVSLKGGIGKVSGMLGGVLLLGVIDNSLNLIGMNVYLIYAASGLIIFIAIILDQSKEKLKSYIYYREDVKRFKKGAN
jgi:ribose/xylose/arabinose/galactoside ABC-type transport system permease subunit